MLLMIDQQVPDIAYGFLERFGVPVALLAVLVWAIFKTGRWIAPRVDKLIARHERLLDTLENELDRHSDLLAGVCENQREVLECLRSLRCVADERAPRAAEQAGG